jgi:hypothetical protein
MKAQAKTFRIQYDANMNPELVLPLNGRECLLQLDEIKTVTDSGKTLDVEIKPHRERRSLDANAYLWVLVGKIAEVLKTDKDSVYLTMLKRYGQYTYVIVKPEAVKRTMQAWRLMEEVGKTKDGKGVQMLAYFGSSTYDTQEMSRLIDGVVSEAKELGIETMTPGEVALMKEGWRKDV